MGPDMVKAIDNVSNLFLDVHLMVTNPENFFESFAKAGADLLVFHIETDPDPTEKIRMVRDLGCQVGLSLNPDKPIDLVLPFLDMIDVVLIMSVYPGYSGQKFIPESLTKVQAVREHIDKHKLACQIEIDGGVNKTTAGDIIAAGVDVVVMGSAFFGEDDRADLVRFIKSL
jgi:ribulose-phosphate 3-epimerase